MQRTLLRFHTRGTRFGLPLGSVAEVTAGGLPRLVPFVPRAVGGILNVRGEPLPVVDAGALLLGAPAGARSHVIALVRDGVRLGVLVDSVARIETAWYDAMPASGEPVRWIEEEGAPFGIVDPDLMFERALQLLTPGGWPGIHGEKPCPTAS